MKKMTEVAENLWMQIIKGVIVRILMFRFFNAHVHFRQDDMLADVACFSSPYEYAVAMGNTTPPIITGEDALAYNLKIKACGTGVRLIMTIMLTNSTTVETIRHAYKMGVRVVKLIPSGTSSNSSDGVRLVDLKNKYPILREIAKLGMIFSVHCELLIDPVTEEKIHPLYREERGIPYFADIIREIPDLIIIFEHASTRKLIEFVELAGPNVFATLTVHHATHTFEFGLYKSGKIKNPFFHCLPCLKSYEDMIAVRETMLSGNPKFLYGADDAPWRKDRKMAINKSNVPAGISTPGIVACPKIVEIFIDGGKLENLPAFAYGNAIKAYGRCFNLKLSNWKQIEFVRRPWTVAESYNDVVPLFAGKILPWQIERKKINLT